jgi:polyisoprenoid-binding protein YceI
MNYTRKSLIWLIAVLPFILAAGPDVQVSIQPSSSITIKGTSTLHNFECTTKTLDGIIGMDHSGNSFTSVDISIPVLSIHSGSSSMDDNMYDALKAKQYPKIQFSLLMSDSTRIAFARADSVLPLQGNLTIGGKQKLIDLPVVAAKTGKGVIHVYGTKKLLMTDFGIDPPSFMFGALKTGNEVTIEFSLELKEPDPQAQAIPTN